ncbi:MAG: hypothetical protein M9909_08885 [Thermomicrobiales bacterium]|nr:hypothetical protein [Thermomicrobiales bacterium]
MTCGSTIGIRRVLHLRLNIQHLKDALAGGHRALERAVLLAELADRGEEAIDHGDEQHELPQRERLIEDHATTDIGDHGGTGRTEEGDGREEHTAVLRGLETGIQIVAVENTEVAAILALAHETLDHAHTGDTLGQIGIDDTDGASRFAVGTLGISLPNSHDHHHDR